MTESPALPAVTDPTGRVRQINKHLGQLIRQRRQLNGLTQTNLGEKLGLTYQQVQKYESGANRIGAGMLVLIAEALGTTPAELLTGLSTTPATALDDSAAPLVRAWLRLPDHHRESVLVFTRLLANPRPQTLRMH